MTKQMKEILAWVTQRTEELGAIRRQAQGMGNPAQERKNAGAQEAFNEIFEYLNKLEEKKNANPKS